MFHVKHSPIDETASLGRTALQHRKGVAIDQKQGEHLGKFRRATGLSAAHFEALDALSTTLHAQGEPCFQLTEYGAEWLSLLNQGALQVTTERARGAKHVNGLEHTGLAGTVFTKEKIEVGAGWEIRFRDVAQALYIKPREPGHGSGFEGKGIAGYQSRIGMTTYSEAAPSPAWIKALLLASDSTICTLSVEITLSTSTR